MASGGEAAAYVLLELKRRKGNEAAAAMAFEAE